MADYDLPDDLIALRRAYLAADAGLQAAGRAVPPHSAVAAGEANPATDDQRQAWWDAQREAREFAVAIQGHQW